MNPAAMRSRAGTVEVSLRFGHSSANGKSPQMGIESWAQKGDASMCFAAGKSNIMEDRGGSRHVRVLFLIL